MTAPEPTLSVVVCTYGRPERLGPLAEQVQAQLGPGDELLVVDQSPGPQAAMGQAAVEGAGGRWMAHHPPGLPGARNRAVAATDRPLLLFLDDDVELHAGCLAAHRGAYRDAVVGGVTGRIVELRLQNNAVGLCNEVGRDGRIRTCLDGATAGAIGSLKGANMSIRRDALMQAGPFEEALGGTALLEDAELSARLIAAGWRLRFVPEAAVTHHHDPAGGVRQATARATLAARFHNTGFFVGRHRPRRDLALVLPVYGAIALRHGGPAAVPGLTRDLIEGWRRGRTTALPTWGTAWAPVSG